jgi:hypothetical protein
MVGPVELKTLVEKELCPGILGVDPPKDLINQALIRD